jgi:DNA repair protein RadA/Sms
LRFFVTIARAASPPKHRYLALAGALPVAALAADLAVMLAIQSSLRGKPLPRGQERLKEAAKLGFCVAVVPKANAPKKPIEGLTIHAVERIEQAIDVVRGL